MRASLLLLAAPLIFAAPAFAQNPQSAQNAPSANDQQLSNTDQQFLNSVAQANQGEIEACLLAENKAPAPTVKAFCRLMIFDHTEMENLMALLANQHGMSLPNGIGQKNQQQMSQMEQQNGEAFDSAFMQAQVQNHQNVIKEFQAEVSNTQAGDVRRLALTALPILRQHLALAEIIQQSLHSGQNAAD